MKSRKCKPWREGGGRTERRRGGTGTGQEDGYLLVSLDLLQVFQSSLGPRLLIQHIHGLEHTTHSTELSSKQ